MKAGLLGLGLLMLATGALAHRLDEYLQATRVSVAADRIELSIALTPGVAIVDRLLAVIDKDRDGRISEEESAAYAQRVLKDIRVEVDEKALAFRVVNNSFPTLDAVKAGVGVIRVEATAAIKRLSVGSHTLALTNSHLPGLSVYLVNALVPKDHAIKITKQTRDEFQKSYRLEFGVNPPRT
jgi:hypothetical protein